MVTPWSGHRCAFAHRGAASRRPGHLASDATPPAGQITAGAQQPPYVAALHMISCYSRPASNQNEIALVAVCMQTCQKRLWDWIGVRFDDVGCYGTSWWQPFAVGVSTAQSRHHGAGLTQDSVPSSMATEAWHGFPTNRQTRLARLQDLIPDPDPGALKSWPPAPLHIVAVGPRGMPCAVEEPSTLPCLALRAAPLYHSPAR
jgi:hypothetical protein